MTKYGLAIILCWFFSSQTSAQLVHDKNSVRLGMDYMSLDAPDDLGLRYLVRYARHVARDRVVVEASLGYLKVKNRRLVFPSFYFTGRPRQRITADLTVSYDFLPTAHHALRLGGGPSVWYRKDDNLREAQSVVDPNGQLTGVVILNEKVDEANIGYHLTAEYEYRLDSRISLSGRLGMATLKRAGISSIVGMNIGYRF